MSVCLIRVKCAKKSETPSPSKPYQVLELLPVWEGITEDDVHFLFYCHGNNSCDQSALARAGSGRRSLSPPPLPPGCFCELTLAGLTPKKYQRNCPRWTAKTGLWNITVLYFNTTTDKTRRKQAFFAVSALWMEGNLSGLPLCDTKNSPTSIPLSLSVSPSSSISSSPPVHPPSLSVPQSRNPLAMLPLTLCFRERYSVNPCWLKDSFVRC